MFIKLNNEDSKHWVKMLDFYGNIEQLHYFRTKQNVVVLTFENVNFLNECTRKTREPIKKLKIFFVTDKLTDWWKQKNSNSYKIQAQTMSLRELNY